MEGLRVRKLADKSTGTRIPRWDPETGEKYLLNPATGLAESWPLLGVAVEGDAPKETLLPIAFVNRGRSELWIKLIGERVVVRSAGPPEDPLRSTHTFVHADQIVLHTIDGDLTYDVVDNPDKWPDAKEGTIDGVGELGFGGDVRHYYRVKKVK